MLFPEGLTRNEHSREFLLLLSYCSNVFMFYLVWKHVSFNFYRSTRKKFGLLEKHKDYVVRAKAFHKKEETIKVSFTCSPFLWCWLYYHICISTNIYLLVFLLHALLFSDVCYMYLQQQICLLVFLLCLNYELNSY